MEDKEQQAIHVLFPGNLSLSSGRRRPVWAKEQENRKSVHGVSGRRRPVWAKEQENRKSVHDVSGRRRPVWAKEQENRKSVHGVSLSS